MLVPPDNIGLVEPGLYRCSKLEADNLAYLETLGLKSIVLLDAENPPTALKPFISDNNIELFNLGGLKISNHNHTGKDAAREGDDDDRSVSEEYGLTKSASSRSLGQRKSISFDVADLKSNKNDAWMLIEKNLIVRAFEIILNKNKYNILIVDGTSTLVSILRKMQKWNFSSIVEEFRIYTGNSSKSHYFAENFLELLEVELVAFEIDQLNQFMKNQQAVHDEMSRTPEPTAPAFTPKTSIDDDTLWNDDGDFDDDDMDDELLSASPQIPANLLKLVEKKRHNAIDVSDEDTHNAKSSVNSPMSASTSYENTPTGNSFFYNTARANLERRRPSMDKPMRPMQHKLRNSLTGAYKSSWDSSPTLKQYSRRNSRAEDVTDCEPQRIRERYDYKYYRSLNKHAVAFDNVAVIRLRLPPNSRLPEWFVRGRNHWEEWNRTQLKDTV